MEAKFSFPQAVFSSKWQFISHKQALKHIETHPIESMFDMMKVQDTNNSPKTNFYKELLDSFFDQVTVATNESLKSEKKGGLIEKEVPIFTTAEIRNFFVLTSFMQDFSFPDYKMHFMTENCLIHSPVHKVMPLSRFQVIAKHLEMKLADILSFLPKLVPYKINFSGCLIFKTKAIETSPERLLLLFDERGFLLNGVCINEQNVIDGIEQCLSIIEQRELTIILPPELNPLQTAAKLHALGFKSLALVSDLNDPYIINVMLRESPLEVFAKNEENHIVLARYFQRSTNNPLFIMISSAVFYNEYSNLTICDQAVDFIQKKQKAATKFWKFSVWKQFCPNTKKPLFFLFKSLVYNWFLNDFEHFYVFQAFKENFFMGLTRKKNEKISEIQLFTDTEDSHANTSKVFNNEDHFPEKMKNCKYCRVCHKSSKKTKTKYRCKACSELYGKDITMCVDKCFRKYHLDREAYHQRKKPIRKKAESVVCEKKKKK